MLRTQVLRDEIGTTMTNIKSRAAQINFPSPHMVRKGRGRRSDSSRKGVPSYMGHTLCVPQEKLDPRIFPATIVLQAHEEKCPFMKKFDSRISMRHNLRQQGEFDSRISMRHDLRQQSGRKGSLTLQFQCRTTCGSRNSRVKLFLIMHSSQ